MEITAHSVSDALLLGVSHLLSDGVYEGSRNGGVLVSPEPVVTIYQHPTHRVLFSPLRDANPFFHLMEALWMLNGQSDLEWLTYFNKGYRGYSDDGKTVHGAYGQRWRTLGGEDQLPKVIKELKGNPASRRVVLTMWSPKRDLPLIAMGKDVPCNTHIYFDCRSGVLNMTVCCRSNDIIWGAYGANMVHFSMLQEYLAAAIGVPMGVYRQFSNNYHVYLEAFPEEKLRGLVSELRRDVSYLPWEDDAAQSQPMVENFHTWDRELGDFMRDPQNEEELVYEEPFFTGVALPMYRAWYERKEKISSGLEAASSITASDWRKACVQWIERREEAKNVSSVS